MKERRDSGYVRKRRQTKSQRAGLIFPVSRFLKKMKHMHPNGRVLEKSAIVLTAIVEYLVAELLEISGN